MAQLRKLYVQNIDGTYEELAAIIADRDLQTFAKTAIKTAIQKYIKNCTANKCLKNQSTERLYFGVFSAFLLDLGLKNIDQVSREHIDQFEAMLLKKMAASSVNRRFKTFKNFFVKCLEWKLIFENPCQGMKKRKELFNPRKAWTREIFDRFISACDGDYVKIFYFLWLTGARQIELLNLRWTDVDFEESVIILKSGKRAQLRRRFPISPELDKLLHSIKMDSAFVFTINKKPFTTDNLYQYSKHRLKRLGLKNFTQYGIRHGFGTKLANEGVSAFYIAELMGHSSLETTKNYVHSGKFPLIDILKKCK